jgi:Protein of unknown function (DUF2786)
MIERIAKLIALAENAATAEEAEAAFQKAQQLASKYAIDLEVARRQAAPKAREVPVTRTIRIGEKGKRSNAMLILLFSTIGRANDVRCLIATDSTFVEASGFPSDLDTVEALWSSLAAAMTRFADALVRDKSAAWRSETTYDWHTGEPKAVSAQGARRSFCEGFMYRIGERLQEARKASIQEADHFHAEQIASGAVEAANLPSSMALALKDKGAEVEAHQWAQFERKYGKRRPGSWKGGRSSGTYSTSASSAGRAAADRASLSGRRAVGA